MANRSILVPTLITLPAVIVLLGLGTWQVQRLGWKEALIAERAAGLAAAPIRVPAAGATAEEVDFRRGTATGRFRHDKEMYLTGRVRNGVAGHHVVTPLVLAGGAAVLVNRGWVPADRKDPARRAAGQVEGTVSVTGILRAPGAKGRFTPDNDPDGNTWFHLDVPAMAAAAGLDGALPYVLDADGTANPGGLPVGGQTPTALRNDHLQYAITWFALAAALAVIYLLAIRKLSRERRADDPESSH